MAVFIEVKLILY